MGNCLVATAFIDQVSEIRECSSKPFPMEWPRESLSVFWGGEGDWGALAEGIRGAKKGSGMSGMCLLEES